MKAPNNDVTIAPNFQLRLQYFLNWCLTLHYYQFPLLPKRIIQIISAKFTSPFRWNEFDRKKEAWRNEARNLTSTPSQCNRLIIYAWLTSLFFHLVPNSSWAGTGTLLLPHLFNRSAGCLKHLFRTGPGFYRLFLGPHPCEKDSFGGQSASKTNSF